jgi:aconitate hydratase
MFDAAENYAAASTPLVIFAGAEYGSGSSRDWAAKGTSLLGVRAVIAESFERIHRSNLIGMGVVPLQFLPGENPTSLGLDGTEIVNVEGITQLNDGVTPRTLRVVATPSDHSDSSKKPVTFDALLRIDTPAEADYYRNGGILPYVVRSLL